MMIEGKTKKINKGPLEGTVVMETKDELTGGDAAKRATIQGIAHHKTVQAANVFSLLQIHQIPTAFIEQYNDQALLCYDCDMLPLELVMRRYAWGSFLQREPQYKRKDGTPHRFDEILCELFHKWAVIMPPLSKKPKQMEEGKARDLYLKQGQWAEGVFTDPYLHIHHDSWVLYPAKKPFDHDQ